MTSVPHPRITPPADTASEQPRHTLRLRLRPKAPTTGYVDGAWWPRSPDLPSELPALLAVLAVRLGQITRVSYNLTEWDAAPVRVTIDGGRTRLGGFRAQPRHTVDLIGMDRQRVTLLVVPPDTDPVAAHEVMMTAADRDNIDTIHDLLSPETPDKDTL